MPDNRLVCRFYEDKYPNVDEVVVARVTKCTEYGAYVALLEYNNIEGMIQASELSRKRIRSIKRIIDINSIQHVSVLRVDYDKGYVDLSKRQISEEDIRKADERYNRAKAVHAVFYQMAYQDQELSVESLYTQIGWPLYKKYKHAFIAFSHMLASDSPLDWLRETAGLKEVDQKLLETFITAVKQKFVATPVTLHAVISAKCFGPSGVDGLKKGLTAGIINGIDIKLDKSPEYNVLLTVMDQDLGFETLQKSFDLIEKTLKPLGGFFEVIKEPYVMTDTNQMIRVEKNSDDESSSDEDQEDKENALLERIAGLAI